MYDLNDIQSFVMVMETENLTESARRLSVSKSTLSRRVSHLESVLGQPLLLRHSNKMQANDAGKAFYPFARKLLETARQSRKVLEHLQDSVSGEIDVTVYSSFARSWFPGEMLTFAEQHPEVSFQLHTASVLDQNCQSDVMIWLGAVSDFGMKAELAGYLSCGLYASERFQRRLGIPDNVAALEHQPWVNLHRLYHTDGELKLSHPQKGSQIVKLPGSRILSDQIGMQMEAIVSGHGIGILPDYMVHRRERHHPGDLIRVLPRWTLPRLPLYLIYPYGQLPRRIQAFLQHMRQASAAIVLAKPGREPLTIAEATD
ncbi:LysR family transcriptional regulator [Vibrio quintilis]|uniref:HTH-type transcriptional regulator CynR n=1 Tax=Vibrio quintilis TaxID=1117707 RepID=A0A1M7YY33_9VIBR|nr:LysR family transcriptional regulator [Vibrio quintilis]SHO57551.1 HTH-type transcriptional regulator CynR [Vibrio quintilis]